MAGFILGLLKSKFKTLPPVEPVSLAGQTIIVTGGNDGIGFQVAKQLATFRPSKLILASRNVAKTEDAIQAIKNSLGGAEVSMEAWSLDLGEFESVIAFAEKANKELVALDILVLNAGVVRPRFMLTKDGHEETYVTRMTN